MTTWRARHGELLLEPHQVNGSEAGVWPGSVARSLQDSWSDGAPHFLRRNETSGLQRLPRSRTLARLVCVRPTGCTWTGRVLRDRRLRRAGRLL